MSTVEHRDHHGGVNVGFALLYVSTQEKIIGNKNLGLQTVLGVGRMHTRRRLRCVLQCTREENRFVGRQDRVPREGNASEIDSRKQRL